MDKIEGETQWRPRALLKDALTPFLGIAGIAATDRLQEMSSQIPQLEHYAEQFRTRFNVQQNDADTLIGMTSQETIDAYNNLVDEFNRSISQWIAENNIAAVIEIKDRVKQLLEQEVNKNI